MNDIVQMNRLSQKCMETIAIISNMHEAAKTMTYKPSQEQINKIAEVASQYQEISEDMKNCLVSFLKEVVNTEQEEMTIDVKETDVGYKL